MKRILLLMAAVLVWNGAALAGELKVAVPVDEFKKIQARLEALEQENAQLKQGSKRSDAAGYSASANTEMQNRLQSMESENNRLRKELSSLSGSPGGQVGSNAETQAKLDALVKENSQLKDAARVGGASAPAFAEEDAGLKARLETMGNDNDNLRQEVKLLQAGALAEVYGENKISAREQYFLSRRKNTSHVFKF